MTVRGATDLHKANRPFATKQMCLKIEEIQGLGQGGNEIKFWPLNGIARRINKLIYIVDSGCSNHTVRVFRA